MSHSSFGAVKCMCEKCSEIDVMIDRYRRIGQRISDQVFRDRAKERIAELEAAKAGCHDQLIQSASSDRARL